MNTRYPTNPDFPESWKNQFPWLQKTRELLNHLKKIGILPFWKPETDAETNAAQTFRPFTQSIMPLLIDLLANGYDSIDIIDYLTSTVFAQQPLNINFRPHLNPGFVPPNNFLYFLYTVMRLLQPLPVSRSHSYLEHDQLVEELHIQSGLEYIEAKRQADGSIDISIPAIKVKPANQEYEIELPVSYLEYARQIAMFYLLAIILEPGLDHNTEMPALLAQVLALLAEVPDNQAIAFLNTVDKIQDILKKHHNFPQAVLGNLISFANSITAQDIYKNVEQLLVRLKAFNIEWILDIALIIENDFSQISKQSQQTQKGAKSIGDLPLAA